jgi:LmbE family N-acetylglucosaminyl deacetylase
MALQEPGKVLVLSPHLDDAAFSCGELIAQFPGAVVATVFAGIPSDTTPLTKWDTTSGFSSGRQAVSLRREEDRNALGILSATPLWLDFQDSQYDAAPSPDGLANVMADLVDSMDPATILFPAGLFHSDHALVHRAMLGIRPRYPDRTWLMYEEALYRCIPRLLQDRLAALLRDGIEVTPIVERDNARMTKKHEAIHAYPSQLRALEHTIKRGYADLFAPERYWRLEAPPATARKHHR